MNAADKEQVVLRLQGRLPEISTEAAAELVDRAEELFCAETGRRVVPERACWLWVDLSEEIHSGAAGGSSGQQISSVRRGDTTISYSERADVSPGNTALRLSRFRVVQAR